jgi:hypothetical protein
MRVGRMLQEWGISRPRRRTPVGPPLVGSMLTQWSRIRLRRCFGRDRERPMAVTKNPGLLLVRQAGAASFSFFSSAAREACHGLGAGQSLALWTTMSDLRRSRFRITAIFNV